MTGRRAYLDYNATAPLRPDVLAAMQDALQAGGNPSSVHAEGRAARRSIETAREQVARLIGAEPEAVVFTSGGTEANARALRPGTLRAPGGCLPERLIVGASEHVSVLHGHGFPDEATSRIGVDPEGRVDPMRLADLLRGAAGSVALVSVAVANSETGIVQPIPDLADVAHAAGAAIHVDAVQAAGRIPLDLSRLRADALSLSAHKLGGPAGVGALAFGEGGPGPVSRAQGGGQERGFRAGTENVAGIVGFGIAAQAALRDLAHEHARLRALRDEAERAILRIAPAAVVFGAAGERLPNTVAFAVPGLPAETALMALDLDGIAVSSGSACSSGKVARSHVLAAMGVPDDLAAGVIRLSLGWKSTQDDVIRFARGFETLVHRLYERRNARAA